MEIEGEGETKSRGEVANRSRDESRVGKSKTVLERKRDYEMDGDQPELWMSSGNTVLKESMMMRQTSQIAEVRKQQVRHGDYGSRGR